MFIIRPTNQKNWLTFYGDHSATGADSESVFPFSHHAESMIL